MMIAIKSYSLALGEWSEYYMCASVMFFAFATMVCWAHYGKESLRAVTKNRAAAPIFIVLFCLFVFVGSVSAPSLAWLVADLSIGIMTIINLPILCANSREIKLETDRFINDK